MLAEVSFQKEANTPWGFRLTGGPQFGMPLTVFEVKEGGRAYEAGVRLGDVLVRINGMEADQLSLEDAHNMIREAGSNINLSISNLEDQELRENEELAKAVASHLTDQEDTDTEAYEVHKSDVSEVDTSEVLHSEASVESELPRTETSVEDASGARSEQEEESDMSKASIRKEMKEDDAEADEEVYVDVNSLPLRPPRPAPEPERAQRKCWHPVMLDTNPPPIIEESTGDEREQPRKHYQEVKTSFTVRLQEERRTSTAAGGATVDADPQRPDADAAVTLQLRTMQRQLQHLVQLPAAIQATLQAVSSHIESLLPCAEPFPSYYDASTLMVQSDDSGEFLEDDFTESLDALTEEEWSDMEGASLQRPASQSDSERSAPEPASVSPPPSPTADEGEKRAKQHKMENLNKCWPWADSAKPVYKIADHYEPVYARCINNKVKWLEEKITDEQILARNLKGI